MRIPLGLSAAAVIAACLAAHNFAFAQLTTQSSHSDDIVAPSPPPIPKLVAPSTSGASTTTTELSLPSTTRHRVATAPASSPREKGASSLPRAIAAGPSTRPTPSPSTNPSPGHLGNVIVTSDRIIQQIAPSLGADTYTIGPAQIESIPGGENASFKEILLRAPGVVEDSFGQEHVRGEHANLTYRVNGVLLPEPLSGFGQELDTRLINNVTLIDGSLPAQFGFHTAGIVDVTTKSGDTLKSNEISFYGGTNDTFSPSIQLGGSSGKLDYFITASNNHSDLGIENPTSSHRALHDYSDQQKAFAYLSYRIDDTSRLSLLMNASNSDFQIPNTPNVPPAFTLAGSTPTNSSEINENQNEQEYYSVVSYQKTADQLAFQLSGFSRYGQIRFTPDPARDLIFQGVSGEVLNSFLTNGIELDGSYIANDHHTLRAGLLADYTTEQLDTDTAVFPINPLTGAQSSDEPFSISDSSGNHAWESGIYAQDEWRLTPKFTLNYGLRYDRFDANFDHEDQVSPRVNLVIKLDDATTAHVGYARYFVPPPVQYVSATMLQKYQNTTNAPNSMLADPPQVERSNYYDAGISHQISKPWSVDLDGFYKQAHNLIDLGQFGAPVILAPFNYKSATVYGAEISTNYKQGGFTAFGNFSWVETMAHDIDSQQFLIDNPELSFIANHNIHLDHESEFTVSAGASYAWKNDRVYVDILYGSGLRAGFANTHQEPQHYPVNIGYEHIFHADAKNTVKFRIDIINLFDESYQLRDGSGIGVGAPQYGERRAIMAGLTYTF